MPKLRRRKKYRVQKLLRHGYQIHKRLKLPMSYYAEDAGEFAHKYYLNNATDNARLTSRTKLALVKQNKPLIKSIRDNKKSFKEKAIFVVLCSKKVCIL